MIIGVTGTSGAGKSEISKILKKIYNLYIIDADEVAKNLSNNSKEYLDEIVNEFGNEILKNDGKLNREKLGELIYNSKEQRELLNDITLKYIVVEIENIIKLHENEKGIVIDAPLLFESGLNDICDTIIGVVANKKIKLKRLKNRDLLKTEILEKRLESQNDNNFFIRNCNIVIKNNYENKKDLEENIKENVILKELLDVM